MTFLGAERADPSGFRSSALGDGLDPFWRWVKEHVVHLWTGLEGARPVLGKVDGPPPSRREVRRVLRLAGFGALDTVPTSPRRSD